MRGLVGAATVLSVLGWFATQAFELSDRMADRVGAMQSAAGYREATVGIHDAPALESGRARVDWKALLSTDDDLPSGQKQRAVWVAQTEALLKQY